MTYIYRVNYKLFQNECFLEVCKRKPIISRNLGQQRIILLLDMTYTLFLVLTICRAANNSGAPCSKHFKKRGK